MKEIVFACAKLCTLKEGKEFELNKKVKIIRNEN